MTIGNAGNAPDPLTGFGAVDYDYRISKHEVTIAQYAEFLNAVAATDSYNLYKTDMADNFGGISRSGTSGSYTYTVQVGVENNPVPYVTWYDAARFSNWMTNGQVAGSTETGVYTLTGPTTIGEITRDLNNPNQVFIPTEDEWYKSAYHDASAGTAGDYFLYATGSDSIPVSDQPGDNAAAVNYYNNDGIANGFNDGYAVLGSTSVGSGVNPRSDVGAYTDAASPYGTFDQSGNVQEWNETRFYSDLYGLYYYGRRGGSWAHNEESQQSSDWLYVPVKFQVSNNTGFRVASPFILLIAGDLNGDSFVGIDDLNIVLINWNQNVTSGDLLQGDATGEGFVGVDDLNVVLGNWNAGTPLPPSSVPEPASSALLLVGSLTMLRRRTA